MSMVSLLLIALGIYILYSVIVNLGIPLVWIIIVGVFAVLFDITTAVIAILLIVAALAYIGSS